METNNIREKLQNIINQFILDDLNENIEELSFNDKLHIIISESSQALAFVATVEDEFDVELEDDDVDLNFFLDFDTMLSRIEKNIVRQYS